LGKRRRDMPAKKASPVERIQESFTKLKEASSFLNTVSDELGYSIANLHAALKKLNLGITSWVRVRGAQDENSGYYWHHDLGYAKFSGKWGLAIRTVSGEYGPPEEEVDQWPFNEAPRSLRIEAVEKIPDLLERLVSDVNDTSAKIIEKSAEVDVYTDAIKTMNESIVAEAQNEVEAPK